MVVRLPVLAPKRDSSQARENEAPGAAAPKRQTAAQTAVQPGQRLGHVEKCSEGTHRYTGASGPRHTLEANPRCPGQNLNQGHAGRKCEQWKSDQQRLPSKADEGKCTQRQV